MSNPLSEESPVAPGSAEEGAVSGSPEAREAPFWKLDGLLTPAERFYVRSHFPTPHLDLGTWRLQVEGAVESPLELTFADLQAMPSQTVSATLECAGNGRTFLDPPAAGLQWELGAVSTAEWSGIPLRAVLERAGLRSTAVEIVLEGADRGVAPTQPAPASALSYSRSLPRDKALQPEVLLAFAMNGGELSPAHGYPVRAVVPGWYAMASVKWLTRIVALEEPYQGYWQTTDYAYWEMRSGLPVRTPITEMHVKSQIARPRAGAIVRAGSSCEVVGAAWTSDARIERVEVSTDDGRTWAEAALSPDITRHGWRLWRHEWRVPERPGRYILRSRATDSRGRIQPLEHDPDFGGYLVAHVLPIVVDVCSGAPPA